jgi:predicted nucleic acid-binding protein
VVSRVGYLDSSALVKLVIAEPETAALRAWLHRESGLIPATSVISRVEVTRACGRSGIPGAADRAADVLAGLSLISLTAETISAAARLAPPSLRSLDALHLAAALELKGSLAAFVAYDVRLAEAARGAGLAALMPT